MSRTGIPLGKLIIGMIVVLALGVGAWFIWGQGSDAAGAGGGPGRGGPGGGMPAMPVKAVAISPARFSTVFEALGRLEAVSSADLSAPQTERIVRVNFDSGQAVKAGQTLVVLNASEEGADLGAAQAALTEAQLQLNRTEKLVEQGIYSPARLEKDQATRDTAAAQLQAIQARTGDRVIRAPFSGVTGLRTINPGDLARSGDVLVTVDDLGRLRLDVYVPERALPALKTGEAVDLLSDAYPDERFAGRLENISPRAEAGTGLIPVRVVVDNPDRRLRPGMTMLAQFRTGDRDRLAVPEDSIYYEGPDTYVYTLAPTEQDGQYRLDRRAVELGVRNDNRAEVISGPAEGTLVVSGGLNRLRPGAMVRPVDNMSPKAPEEAPARSEGDGA